MEIDQGKQIMTDRERALRGLGAGDIFHGRSPNGASLICLVTAVTEGTIFARRITTQDDHEFDRQSGTELGERRGRIDCIAPLPPNVHEILLALDRRGRSVAEMYRNGIEPDPDQYKLTSAEREAFRALDEHIAANRI